tara:strand:- start:180 stop:581 length:402 start_codon:yes stop_codon:yes gene_type:complete
MTTTFMPLKQSSTFISPMSTSLLSSVPVMMITDFTTSTLANKMAGLKNRVGFSDYLRVPSGERHNLYTERVHQGIVDSRANLPDVFRNINDNVSVLTKTTDNVFTKREFQESSDAPPAWNTRSFGGPLSPGIP